MMRERFKDRQDAGRQLAERLNESKNRDNALILALPRGGVPVAYEVSEKLDVPMDVFLVRKLGVPGHEELAMGAIATGGIRVVSEDLLRRLGIGQDQVEKVARREKAELDRRENVFREGRPAPRIEGKTVILVDDGAATGSTLQAAAAAVNQRGPRRLVIAVPTASPSAAESLRPCADEFVSLITPAEFMAVGEWYDRFDQTSDEEARRVLSRARRPELETGEVSTAR